MRKNYRGHLSPHERHPVIGWAFDNGLIIKQLLSLLEISAANLHYWDVGQTKPSWAAMRKISAVTKNAVTPEQCRAYWLNQRKEHAA